MHILTSFKNTFVEMSLFIALEFNWLICPRPGNPPRAGKALTFARCASEKLFYCLYRAGNDVRQADGYDSDEDCKHG